MVGNFYMIYEANLGASIVQNEALYAKVFMNPLYHFNEFFLGVLLAFVYWNFSQERITENMGVNSIYGRTVEFIRSNTLPRYIIYLIGVAMMVGPIYW